MQARHLPGFSLLELIAVIGILAILAVVVLTRVSGANDSANIAACFAYKGEIEIQAELWNYNNGVWPAGNLGDIGTDLNYFPTGLPLCPVDGTAYTIDSSTGRVIGHNH